MTVQGAVIDVNDDSPVATRNGRQNDSLRSFMNAPAGGGDILRRADGRKDLGLEGVAASSEERRRVRRYCQRLALTMSVFNQGAVFEAQMVNCGQDGICAETGHRVLPGASIHVRMDTRQAVKVGKDVLQGLRKTALGEVKWFRTLGQGHSPRYHIGIRYYPCFY